MSIIEKQTELGKSIFAINTNTLKEFATLQRENFEKYIAANRSFGEKLPEVKDLSTFVSLQREYGETLWSNAKAAVEAHNGIVSNAFTDTRDALSKAFTKEQVEEVAAPVKTKSKAKTKAAA